ncbi:hypothetical protein SAMN05660865_01843 [Caloramator fervidus]|uniref:Uncharacterized protein n=1 Tax=Caloramator fervidus TaxID=29344 RepID=A0A1H5XSC7_9CLOT|nr:hypothetical protein SAMN05660865_01843 [Caloramator fervidus]
MLRNNFINNLLNLKDVFVKNIVNGDDFVEFHVETKKNLMFALLVALLLLKSMTTEPKKLKTFLFRTRKLSLSLKNVDMFVKIAASVSLKI